jgi:amidase
MQRRKFLQYSLAGGALALSNPLRGWPLAPAVEPRNMDVTAWSAAQIQQKMAAGELSARALAEAYLEHIAAIDQNGPTINAVIELNPQALEIADARDAERAQGHIRGPLHGVCVLIKDNIDTADSMQTTAGSLALEGSIAARDAFVVEKMRAAGAVILGKSNLSEWANFRSTRSSSGWSSRGGQTRNPHVLDRSPCGSSSGSGAAVAAALCTVAVGTETDGSVVCPSTSNGIVGIKPTLGLVSRSGIIPIAHSQDTAGPMGRTVADAAALLGAMTGVDQRDAATAQGKAHMQTNYLQYLDDGALKGARLGIARAFFGFDDRVDRIMEESISALRHLGAEVIDPVDLPKSSAYDDSEYEVLLYEFKADLNAYLSDLGPGARVKNLQELIAFNEANRERVMPYFYQEIFLQAQEKGPLTETAYSEALANNYRLSREQGIDATLAKYQLDAIVAPTGGPAWAIDWVNGDHYGGGCSSPAAVSGYPHITVPAGFVHNLPVGISFFAGAWSEPRLIALAYAFEQGTQARREPKFLPSLEF